MRVHLPPRLQSAFDAAPTFLDPDFGRSVFVGSKRSPDERSDIREGIGFAPATDLPDKRSEMFACPSCENCPSCQSAAGARHCGKSE